MHNQSVHYLNVREQEDCHHHTAAHVRTHTHTHIQAHIGITLIIRTSIQAQEVRLSSVF